MAGDGKGLQASCFNLKSSQMIQSAISVHLNSYAVGLQPLYIFNSFSAGIDFRRQY